MTPKSTCKKCKYRGLWSGNSKGTYFCDHLGMTGMRREYKGDVCLSFTPKTPQKILRKKK